MSSPQASAAEETADLLNELGVPEAAWLGGSLSVTSPITGEVLTRVHETTDATGVIGNAHEAYLAWRCVPAPRRGELVRLLGEELRKFKTSLGKLVTLEAGKITAEADGEVQEMIDICDFAVGLSRQLYGLTIATERPNHRMIETWQPLGVVGIISAFNFPVAVWSWNAALAFVCGNSVIWKPSEKTPLTALAVHALFERAAARFGGVPEGLSALLIGGRELGERLVDDVRVPLVSATGSTAMGKAVAPKLAARFARSILELGGNNAAIVCPSANLDLALRAILFSAIGTSGQRCTSLRRLFIHESIYDGFVERLKRSYRTVRVADPRAAGTLSGPLIDEAAFIAMQRALRQAREEDGTVYGGQRLEIEECAHGFYVAPALVEMPGQSAIVRHETFGPILYVMRYSDLNEVIRRHNDVPQGLSSSIFTTDLREAELFTSAEGSDCGIANVNIGPSGAEIGGAFGGEKETGGGREAGSDSWRAYMRRVTTTVNYGNQLPLAQGIEFPVRQHAD